MEYNRNSNPYSNNYTNQYLQQSIMTASPGELTLMLYDGCIKQLNFGMKYMEEKKLQEKNLALQKAQAIICELNSTLDLKYEVSNNLYYIYDFITGLIIEANIHNDSNSLNEALRLVTELRDTWTQAIKLERVEAYKDCVI